MPRQIPYRLETMKKWFHNHVWLVRERQNLLLDSVDGDLRWLNAVASREYPKWAHDGPRKRLFRCEVNKWARMVLEDPISYEQDMRPEDAGRQSRDGKDEEEGRRAEDSRASPCQMSGKGNSPLG